MRVQEIEAGLWRWTGWHEEWNAEVGSVYLETPEGVCLIDPIVPPEDEERFLRALDRDVDRRGGTVHVLVTVFWHTRHARRLLDRYGGRLWAVSRGRAAVARRGGEVSDPFRPGDALPGGIEAYATGRGTEVVYFLPRYRTLVAGDVLLGSEDGALSLCPESWLPAGVGHARLRAALRPLRGPRDRAGARLPRGARARGRRTCALAYAGRMNHDVLGTAIEPPFPEGLETAIVGMGCFWGAERVFWRAHGVHTTAVGYAGGTTESPTYEQVCSGRTGHAEVVLVVFDRAETAYEEILRLFWENHDPTQGDRQGNDVGTQYRSAIYWTSRRSAPPPRPPATRTRPCSPRPATARSRPR